MTRRRMSSWLAGSSQAPHPYVDRWRSTGGERIAGLGRQQGTEAEVLDPARALEAVGDLPAPGRIGAHGAEGLPATGEPDLELDELAAGRHRQARHLAGKRHRLAVEDPVAA